MSSKKNLPEKFLNYFNNDYSLVIILCLLEQYDTEEKYIFFSSLLKQKYYEVPILKNWHLDTGDYESIEEMIFEFTQNMSEELKFFTMPSYRVEGFYGVEKDFFQKILNDIRENIVDKDDEADYLAQRAEQLCELKKFREKKFKEVVDKAGIDSNFLMNISLSQSERNIFIPLLDGIAEHFVVYLKFNESKVIELKSNLRQYLKQFSNDHYINDYSVYVGIRHYFSKQLENFFAYIATLTKVDDVIHIPLTTLQNSDFEIIKLLAYLQLNKRITILSWKDKEFLRVKFLFQPISIEGLYKDAAKEDIENEAEDGLSHYNAATHVLFFKGKPIEFMSKPNQRRLLEVLFPNRHKKWTYKEIECFDDPILGVDFDPDPEFWRKHYSAAVDINTAIATETTIKDFLRKGTKNIQINQQYIQ